MYYLPLQPHPSFKYRISLDGFQFEFRFRWHPDQTIWTVDMKSEDLGVGIAGFALVTGFDLLFGRALLQVGKLMLIDLQGQDDPDFDGFGDRFKLAYWTREEVYAGT